MLFRSDLGSAPGGKCVRLREVRVVDEDGRLADSVDIRRPVGIEISFTVLRDEFPVFPKIKVIDREGNTAFSTVDTSLLWSSRPALGDYVATVPAQMRRGPRWFAGSADAIFQNLNLVYDDRPDHILVFGADHIYRMDPRQMLAHHVASGAGVTVAAIRSPIEEAGSFGVIEADAHGRIHAFREKPADPAGLPDAPHQVLASMGNYIFTTEALIRAVTTDAADEGSNHDVGGDIIPRMVAEGDAFVYDFELNDVPGATDRDRGYWRDVGTLDSYYSANMDLISVHPVFNLYNMSWPIYSWSAPAPPAKFVFEDGQRKGQAFNSMLCAGTIVSGGTVRGSILSPDVMVHSGALVEGSVILQGVQVGQGAVVRGAIIDKNVVIPPEATIGVDPDEDRQRYTVSDGGVVVIGKNQKILP